MTEIFLSYSTCDKDSIESFVHTLESYGFKIWWDRKITAGEDLSDVILKHIKLAKVVVAIWTPKSTQSLWVRAEVRKAVSLDKCITLKSSEVNELDIPLPFNGYHTAHMNDIHAIVKALRKFGLVSNKVDDELSSVQPMPEKVVNIEPLKTGLDNPLYDDKKIDRKLNSADQIKHPEEKADVLYEAFLECLSAKEYKKAFEITKLFRASWANKYDDWLLDHTAAELCLTAARDGISDWSDRAFQLIRDSHAQKVSKKLLEQYDALEKGE